MEMQFTVNVTVDRDDNLDTIEDIISYEVQKQINTEFLKPHLAKMKDEIVSHLYRLTIEKFHELYPETTIKEYLELIFTNEAKRQIESKVREQMKLIVDNIFNKRKL